MTRSHRTKFATPPTYYPARLDAVHVDAHPLNRYDNFPHDSESSRRVRYFRNYRNETLSRFTMPPCEWMDQGSSYIPKPSGGAADVLRNYDRLLAIPVNDVTTVDPVRMKEIDDFYKCVQLQREQYKDHTGRLHPLKYFRPAEYNFQSSPSLSTTYLLKRLETYTAYKVPPVLPLTYERRLKTTYLPEFTIAGVHARGNCIAYKT